MQSLSSAKENRLFVYEVVGLSQNDNTDNLDYSIRKSGSVFLTVPYSRMNQEMRRITRLGGRIVSSCQVGYHPEEGYCLFGRL